MMNKNDRYETLFVEAQQDLSVTDPFGNRMMIWQGMQFKFSHYGLIEIGCGCNGQSKKTVTQYIINAYATCCEGQYLFNNSPGLGIIVNSLQFIETENVKYPPIITSMHDELAGTDVDLFTPPWQRKIPREGGVWYTDPWHSEKDGSQR